MVIFIVSSLCFSAAQIAASGRRGQAMRMATPVPVRIFTNPRHGVPGVVVLPGSGFRRASAEIRGWVDHGPAPLLDCPALAAEIGLEAVQAVEVRSPGSAYAVARLVQAELARRGALGDGAEAITLVCTDEEGDDIAAIAQGATRIGLGCVAFVAQHHRRQAEAAPGGHAMVLEGGRAEAVLAAEREGWLFVSAVARPGYTEVPRDIMQGDRLVVEEALHRLPGSPTHVLVPGGTGGLAAAAAVQLRLQCGAAPRLVVTEPEGSGSLMAMAEGRPPAVAPSLLAWQELERSAFAYLAAPDPVAALKGFTGNPAGQKLLGLGSGSRVLLLLRPGASPELHGTAKPSS
jgi:diaminopropionate ammonia-lyase